MKDIIYREDAISTVKKWFDFIELNGDICIDGLISLPSAERTEWIPVSERPPEIGEDVLFCDIDGDIYRGHRAKHRWWSETEDVKDVVAWMPLPKPYRLNNLKGNLSYKI